MNGQTQSGCRPSPHPKRRTPPPKLPNHHRLQIPVTAFKARRRLRLTRGHPRPLQAPALEEGDQIPSNPTTPTTDKTRARVEAMQGYLQTAISIDWDQVNQARPEWNARWSRSIER